MMNELSKRTLITPKGDRPMNKKSKHEKEQDRKAWDYAIGMSKVDGGEPSQEFLDLVEKEINGEISTKDMRKKLIDMYAE